MAVSNAQLGYGTLLKVGDGGSPEIFVTVAEVTGITPPNPEATEVDVTHMESPNSFREYIAGLKEPGEMSFTVNYNPNDSTHKNSGRGLLKLFQDRTVVNWQMVFDQFAGDPTWAWPGYVKGFAPDVQVDGAVVATVTIKVTGAITVP